MPNPYERLIGAPGNIEETAPVPEMVRARDAMKFSQGATPSFWEDPWGYVQQGVQQQFYGGGAPWYQRGFDQMVDTFVGTNPWEFFPGVGMVKKTPKVVDFNKFKETGEIAAKRGRPAKQNPYEYMAGQDIKPGGGRATSDIFDSLTPEEKYNLGKKSPLWRSLSKEEKMAARTDPEGTVLRRAIEESKVKTPKAMPGDPDYIHPLEESFGQKQARRRKEENEKLLSDMGKKKKILDDDLPTEDDMKRSLFDDVRDDPMNARAPTSRGEWETYRKNTYEPVMDKVSTETYFAGQQKLIDDYGDLSNLNMRDYLEAYAEVSKNPKEAELIGDAIEEFEFTKARASEILDELPESKLNDRQRIDRWFKYTNDPKRNRTMVTLPSDAGKLPYTQVPIKEIWEWAAESKPRMKERYYNAPNEVKAERIFEREIIPAFWKDQIKGKGSKQERVRKSVKKIGDLQKELDKLMGKKDKD